jgi:hypothetical protein
VNLKNWMSALMRIWEYFDVALANVKNYWQVGKGECPPNAGVKHKRAHWRFCASETPIAPGKLKRSKWSSAKESAW